VKREQEGRGALCAACPPS